MTSTTKTTVSPALVRACSAATRHAEQLGLPVVASFTVTRGPFDPLDIYTAGTPGATRFLLEKPNAAEALVGLGAAAVITGDGASRFNQINAGLQKLCANAVTDGDKPLRASGLTLLGGFAFNPLAARSSEWSQFPGGMLILPELLATAYAGQFQLTVNYLCSPGIDSDMVARHMQSKLDLAETAAAMNNGAGAHTKSVEPPDNCGLIIEQIAPDAWKRSVATATERIRSGAIEKVVLARAVKVHAAQDFRPANLLRYLKSAYPNCYLFAIDLGDSCFLGATPEQLVALDHSIVQAMCLASSAPRGANEAEDEAFGRALLASAKDRREHDIVVRTLTGNLSKVCSNVSAPAVPNLLHLTNVMHLHTPVSARLPPGRSIIDVVEQLHPTPAVGGFPRDAAFTEIAAHEPTDRGWYAGPIGWVDSQGEGEFAVAIRSALIAGNKATLYAGCGIVVDSDPEAEFEESCLKLRPMLAAMEADQGCQKR